MKTKKAFTLVELLVVISIIAVLLSVLIPAMSKAREQSRMIVCRNNERNLFLASNLWSNEHDNWVIAGNWYAPYKEIDADTGKTTINDYSIGKYTGAGYSAKDANNNQSFSTMVCPSAVNARFYGVDPSFKTNPRYYSYAANGWVVFNVNNYYTTSGYIGYTGPGRAVGSNGSGNLFSDYCWQEHGLNKTTDIRQPAKTVYFMDHEYYTVVPGTFDPFRNPDKIGTSTYRYRTRWHNWNKNKWYGVANILWVDGHATVEPKDLSGYEEKLGSGSSTTPRWYFYFWRH